MTYKYPVPESRKSAKRKLFMALLCMVFGALFCGVVVSIILAGYWQPMGGGRVEKPVIIGVGADTPERR